MDLVLSALTDTPVHHTRNSHHGGGDHNQRTLRMAVTQQMVFNRQSRTAKFPISDLPKNCKGYQTQKPRGSSSSVCLLSTYMVWYQTLYSCVVCTGRFKSPHINGRSLFHERCNAASPHMIYSYIHVEERVVYVCRYIASPKPFTSLLVW